MANSSGCTSDLFVRTKSDQNVSLRGVTFAYFTKKEWKAVQALILLLRSGCVSASCRLSGGRGRKLPKNHIDAREHDDVPLMNKKKPGQQRNKRKEVDGDLHSAGRRSSAEVGQVHPLESP